MGTNEEKNIDKLYIIADNLNNRVGELEKRTAISDTQIDMIFKILEEIKTSVSLISKNLDDLKDRPNVFLYSISSAVVVGVVVTVITKVIG